MYSNALEEYTNGLDILQLYNNTSIQNKLR